MELHALHGTWLVPQPHDGAGTVFLGSPGADLQFWGQIFFLDDERVITRGGHRHGEALKDGFVIVHHGAGLAMHDVSGAHHTASKGFSDCLMSQTNAEHRYFAGEVADQVDADSSFMRRARARRNHDALRAHRLGIGYRNLIVAANLDLGSQFAEILDQVIGKRIVVIEYEDQASSPSSNRLSPEFAGLPVGPGHPSA